MIYGPLLIGASQNHTVHPACTIRHNQNLLSVNRGRMAPMMALKAATPFLGCTTGFRARCRGTQASARTKYMAPQAYSITLKTPDGEQKIDCMGECAVSLRTLRRWTQGRVLHSRTKRRGRHACISHAHQESALSVHFQSSRWARGGPLDFVSSTAVVYCW